MSAISHIGRTIPKKLITAILRAGEGQRMLKLMAELPGVLSISHHHARGIGSSRVRKAQLYYDEKDVLILLAEQEYADQLFRFIYQEGRLGQPGAGLVFVENVLRGHPLMPRDLADW